MTAVKSFRDGSYVLVLYKYSTQNLKRGTSVELYCNSDPSFEFAIPQKNKEWR